MFYIISIERKEICPSKKFQYSLVKIVSIAASIVENLERGESLSRRLREMAGEEEEEEEEEVSVERQRFPLQIIIDRELFKPAAVEISTRGGRETSDVAVVRGENLIPRKKVKPGVFGDRVRFIVPLSTIKIFTLGKKQERRKEKKKKNGEETKLPFFSFFFEQFWKHEEVERVISIEGTD